MEALQGLVPALVCRIGSIDTEHLFGCMRVGLRQHCGVNLFSSEAGVARRENPPPKLAAACDRRASATWQQLVLQFGLENHAQLEWAGMRAWFNRVSILLQCTYANSRVHVLLRALFFEHVVFECAGTPICTEMGGLPSGTLTLSRSWASFGSSWTHPGLLFASCRPALTRTGCLRTEFGTATAAGLPMCMSLTGECMARPLSTWPSPQGCATAACTSWTLEPGLRPTMRLANAATCKRKTSALHRASSSSRWWQKAGVGGDLLP